MAGGLFFCSQATAVRGGTKFRNRPFPGRDCVLQMDLKPHIEKFRRRFTEIEAALSDPATFDNQQRAQEMSKEYARLKELVACGDNFFKTQAQLAENRALLQSEKADSEPPAPARISTMVLRESVGFGGTRPN